MRYQVLAVLGAAFLAPTTAAEVLNVPADHPSIQAAIDAAESGDVIVVAPGVYAETIDFAGKAVTVRSAAGRAVTTIDGQGLGTVVTCANGEGPDTMLRGFTITGGTGSSAPDNPMRIVGGGMLIFASDPMVIACRFVDNEAFHRGGGLYAIDASPVVRRCTFRGNRANGGGGMFIDRFGDDVGACDDSVSPTIEECRFIANDAADGGALFSLCSSATITACRFEDNHATFGGAVTNDRTVPGLTFNGCEFVGNRAMENGGAMSNQLADPTVIDCAFSGNAAYDSSGRGGAVSNEASRPLIIDCSFRGNWAGFRGGTMFSNAPEDDLGSLPDVSGSRCCGSWPDDYAGPWIDAGGNEFTETCVTRHGVDTGDRLGASVAGVGDVDGDGWPDHVVGAPFNDEGGAMAGKVYVLCGSTGDLLYAKRGRHAGDRFGWAVAGVGDVDDDGHDDFCVGAPHQDDNGPDAGRITVYSGADGGRIRWHDGVAAGDQLGRALSGGVDVDGDSVPDYVAGAPLNDVSGSNAGAVDVFSGASGQLVQQLMGEDPGDRFGWSVAMLRPAAGETIGQIVVGAPRNDQREPDAGKVYVYSGGLDAAAHTALGRAEGDRFGHAVAAAGATEAGTSDFIVGSPYWDDRGRVDLFSGADGSRRWTRKSNAPGSRLGWSLAGAGDVDGDGLDDVVIGAPEHDAGGDRAGRVFVRSGVNGWIIRIIDGETGDRLGMSIAGAGDLNGDDRAEILIGAPRDDTVAGNAGRADVGYAFGAPPRRRGGGGFGTRGRGWASGLPSGASTRPDCLHAQRIMLAIRPRFIAMQTKLNSPVTFPSP